MQRPEDHKTIELRHPRTWFFLLGPFYLLWLRLWLDAAVVAIGIWAVTHGAAGYVRKLTGAPPRVDLDRALATLALARTARPGDPAAAQAVTELVRSLLPLYAGAFALLGLMLVLTALFPRYLRWRMAGRGWRQGGGANGGEESASTRVLAEPAKEAQARPTAADERTPSP